MHRLATLLFIAPALGALSGCIVQDIHDQIAMSNEKLTTIDEGFARVERANELLEHLDTQLATMDSIDENLTSINTRLATLEGDLKAVSEHLASLRMTINNIDSTIPFLKISGDDEEAKDDLESGNEPDAEPAEPAPSETPAENPAE